MTTDRPSDLVLDFILDPHTRELVTQGSESWPYSRLTGSRLSKIGYKLIVLRCAQLGIAAPTRSEAESWARR